MKQNMNDNTTILGVFVIFQWIINGVMRIKNNLGTFLFLILIMCIIIGIRYSSVFSIYIFIYIFIFIFLVIYYYSDTCFKIDIFKYILFFVMIAFLIICIIFYCLDFHDLGFIFLLITVLSIIQCLTFPYVIRKVKGIKEGIQGFSMTLLLLSIITIIIIYYTSDLTVNSIYLNTLILLVPLYMIGFFIHVLYYHGNSVLRDASFLSFLPKLFGKERFQDADKLDKSPLYILLEGVIYEPFYKFGFLKNRTVIRDWHMRYKDMIPVPWDKGPEFI
jgi:hypothetical protein